MNSDDILARILCRIRKSVRSPGLLRTLGLSGSENILKAQFHIGRLESGGRRWAAETDSSSSRYCCVWLPGFSAGRP
jgi:hypothetical protein